MPRQVSKDELAEAEECFTIFAKQGKLPIEELGMALRSLGFNPSNTEMDRIISDIGSPYSVTFEVFKSILAKDLPSPNTAEEIREAFGVFDKDGNGTISANELKHLLMSTGEKLTEEEVNLMIRNANIDEDGQILYEQFVQTMAKP